VRSQGQNIPLVPQWQTACVGATADIRAFEISVEQVVTLLREQYSDFLEAVASGAYVFWIGSGISRDRVPDVGQLVDRILVFLQGNIDPSDAGCPYRAAFNAALELADLSALESEHVDIGQDFTHWQMHAAIVKRLGGRYSELLDIKLPGKPSDYILWEIVDPAATYGGDLAEPDAEHYCLAVLVLEGALPEVVSANWDGLIERAINKLAGPDSSVMTVCVTSDDFRSPPTLVRILKFHGCAVRAGADEDRYRPYLVGRRSQITHWPQDEVHRVMRAEMASLAARRRTLMVGLSAQDSNIQALFSEAKAMLAWRWPVVPPAFVFAEDAIGSHQRNILSVVYGDSYEGNDLEIATSALVRAYGKPLLFGLMLSVIGYKFAELAKAAWGSDHDGAAHSAIEGGVAVLLSAVSEAIITPSDFEVRRVIAHVAQSMSLLRDGQPLQADSRYLPISTSPAHVMVEDPNISSGGLPNAALALAILGTEYRQGTWGMTVETTAQPEGFVPVIVKAGEMTSRLFFAADASVAVQLELGGHVDDTDGEVVIVHSARRPHRLQRSPTAAPGRTGERAARHVEMSEVLEGSPSYLDTRRRFREELTL
jgi:SIR2-like domain